MEHHRHLQHHGHGGAAGDMAATRRAPLAPAQPLSLSSAHEAALRSVQKPPAKPWRAGAGGLPAPVPPKVYRVEPREFRDLVQRLTGAPALVPDHHHHQRPPPPHHVHAVVSPAQPVPVRASRGAASGGGEEMYAPWCSTTFPLASVDAHHGM